MCSLGEGGTCSQPTELDIYINSVCGCSLHIECTLNLNEEASSAVLQSNGNDCTPGMSEECICVSQWSALMKMGGGGHGGQNRGRED